MGEIRAIGVVGAGQMGAGIAHVLALAGYEVRLFDVSPEALSRGLATIGVNMQRQIKKGMIPAEAKSRGLERIRPCGSIAAMAEADMVIEAAPEVAELKMALHRDLDTVMRRDAILATNTSSISITRLAAATQRPDRFLGVHFFYPVPVMELVEVIRGLQTSDDTLARATSIVAAMGKTLTVSADAPGFIVNRLLVPLMNEAIFALSAGVADVVTIDTAMQLGANHPMGPFTLADFVGLDTVLAAQRVLHEGLGEAKYRPAPLLVQMVDAGWLGRKSGKGFYDYAGAEPVPNASISGERR